MVVNKVKATVLFPRIPASPKRTTPRRSSPHHQPQPKPKTTPASSFTRSFASYFPRSSAQVRPKPPDVAELLRIVEQLQEREARLRAQLIEFKLLKETVAVVPFLEKQLKSKDVELKKLKDLIHVIELENHTLRTQARQLSCNSVEERQRMAKRIEELEAELEVVTKTSSEQCSSSNDEFSSSQRFRGLIDVSSKSNLLKNFKKQQEVVEEEMNVEAADQCSEKGEILVPKPSPPLPKLKSLPPIPPPLPPAFNAVQKSRPPPPPPMPLAKGQKSARGNVRRVPEVVEFYHSIMRRDTKNTTSGGGAPEIAGGAAGNTRDMIGEIENRSSHLLAIKTDVETQGESIRSLIKEVENAAFSDIEEVVAFVKWLDDKLSLLVDERAVLKHFDWPERKADAMREAAFGYCDLKKLEGEVLSFQDDSRQPYASALKKMQALLEKLEQAWYNLSRIREGAIQKYKGFRIPWEWLLDTGYVSQIKLASVKLAMKYVKRVSSELHDIAGSPEEEELMLLGVRFAFRVHQFAGGFDVETMRAFQELKKNARTLRRQGQSQCRYSSC